ncbi:MAG TPA: hypothetical protein PLL06_00840 [Acidobacteriota bacterium]|nr:hypothetical protein [Acidobacteriota bacterium]HMZ78214.1 hypothetical protein [Acidobacteriota bacterium]HNB69820.1 hypothetical protein [Acidobacteriota bacterium]HND17791.1 hypothetical protein [Acidobacteriota bacterium]HNG91144.1 hypothetical protein [Acidobacteriota bacterium]
MPGLRFVSRVALCLVVLLCGFSGVSAWAQDLKKVSEEATKLLHKDGLPAAFPCSLDRQPGIGQFLKENKISLNYRADGAIDLVLQKDSNRVLATIDKTVNRVKLGYIYTVERNSTTSMLSSMPMGGNSGGGSEVLLANVNTAICVSLERGSGADAKAAMFTVYKGKLQPLADLMKNIRKTYPQVTVTAEQRAEFQDLPVAQVRFDGSISDFDVQVNGCLVILNRKGWEFSSLKKDASYVLDILPQQNISHQFQLSKGGSGYALMPVP